MDRRDGDPDAGVDTAIKQIISRAIASAGVIDIYAETGRLLRKYRYRPDQQESATQNRLKSSPVNKPTKQPTPPPGSHPRRDTVFSATKESGGS